jgi:hypothetical protein
VESQGSHYTEAVINYFVQFVEIDFDVEGSRKIVFMMALVSTRSRKIMFLGSKVRLVHKADNFTTIC